MAPNELLAALQLASATVHIPAETLAFGMLHYMAVTAADPLDEARQARILMLGEVNELLQEIIDPAEDDDDMLENADASLPDLPEAVLDDRKDEPVNIGKRLVRVLQDQFRPGA